MAPSTLTLRFDEMGRESVPLVGGKNASLGEMVRNLRGQGIDVPDGFATTSSAYWKFVDANGLRDTIARTLRDLGTGNLTLAQGGAEIRGAFLRADWPRDVGVAHGHEASLPRPYAMRHCRKREPACGLART